MSEEGVVPYVAEALHDATTDQLLAELKVRFPVCVFAGLQEAMGDPDASTRHLFWSGCAVSAVGLMVLSQERIMRLLHTGPDAGSGTFENG